MLFIIYIQSQSDEILLFIRSSQCFMNIYLEPIIKCFDPKFVTLVSFVGTTSNTSTNEPKNDQVSKYLNHFLR